MPDPTLAHELRAGVAAIIRNGEEQILLQRRSDNRLWGLPGGAVEIGESVRQAIAREVEEETGLLVEVERLVGVYSDPAIQIVRYPDGNVVHYVSIFFACRIQGGSLRTCAETLELGFFDPRALPEHLVPMHRVRIGDALANRAEAFIR
jgi:ADP-ribose pyrophosphatase YjhB (NUDIX family)